VHARALDLYNSERAAPHLDALAIVDAGGAGCCMRCCEAKHKSKIEMNLDQNYMYYCTSEKELSRSKRGGGGQRPVGGAV
jgi:hypothetical protein